MSHPVWIAFGSNQGDPAAQLVRARTTLGEQMQEEAASSLYRTPPWGGVAQPDFLNAVVRYRTSYAPKEVLALLMECEQAQGRVRTLANGPRTLDLDLLLYGDRQVNTATLTIPHPRMHERAFVLVPMAEIDPKKLIVGHGRVCDCLAALAPEAAQLPIEKEARWL